MRIPPMPPRDDRPAGERCEVSLRDHFAAAAVTGLLSNMPRYQLGVIAVQAYDIADEMLRERLRSGATESRETVCPHVRGTVTQHCSLNFTLTDEEREAIETAAWACGNCNGFGGIPTRPAVHRGDEIADTLRKLLERLHT